jgi:hypothetical protein
MQNVFFFKIISNAAVWYFGPLNFHFTLIVTALRILNLYLLLFRVQLFQWLIIMKTRGIWTANTKFIITQWVYVMWLTYKMFIVKGIAYRDNNIRVMEVEHVFSNIWYHRPRVDNWNYLHLRWLSVWEFKSIVIRLWSEVNDRNHSVTLATCDWHHCICTSFPPYSTYNVNVT